MHGPSNEPRPAEEPRDIRHGHGPGTEARPALQLREESHGTRHGDGLGSEARPTMQQHEAPGGFAKIRGAVGCRPQRPPTFRRKEDAVQLLSARRPGVRAPRNTLRLPAELSTDLNQTLDCPLVDDPLRVPGHIPVDCDEEGDNEAVLRRELQPPGPHDVITIPAGTTVCGALGLPRLAGDGRVDMDVPTDLELSLTPSAAAKPLYAPRPAAAEGSGAGPKDFGQELAQALRQVATDRDPSQQASAGRKPDRRPVQPRQFGPAQQAGAAHACAQGGGDEAPLMQPTPAVRLPRLPEGDVPRPPESRKWHTAETDAVAPPLRGVHTAPPGVEVGPGGEAKPVTEFASELTSALSGMLADLDACPIDGPVQPGEVPDCKLRGRLSPCPTRCVLPPLGAAEDGGDTGTAGPRRAVGDSRQHSPTASAAGDGPAAQGTVCAGDTASQLRPPAAYEDGCPTQSRSPLPPRPRDPLAASFTKNEPLTARPCRPRRALAAYSNQELRDENLRLRSEIFNLRMAVQRRRAEVSAMVA